MKRVSCHRVISTLCLAAVFSMLIAAQSWAGGGQHYPNGVEDFMVGALPPPGTYLVNYMLLVQKNSLRDNSGNALSADFNAGVFAEVPRLIYVTPFTLLGANWAVQAFLPTYSADVTATSTAIAPLNFDANDKGVGDIIFSPLILGWHFGPELHAVFALDMWAPTGNYDNANPATQILSKNHWTFEPVLAVSYLKEGFDISAKLMYDFNTRNSDTSTDPGQEFHIDWALGYSLKNGLTGGLAGYNYWQITDDEVSGVKQQDQKSEVGGVGVAIKYWPKQGPFSMVLKQYWEYGAKNIATGPQTQFKIIYAF
ncbi:MAG: transporter [Geobacteraceae bacterium]|nr:transporter [Geobacteraceae bacterium]